MELLAGAVDSVEVRIAGNTFQQKTKVRSQTSRMRKEGRGSGRCTGGRWSSFIYVS